MIVGSITAHAINSANLSPKEELKDFFVLFLKNINFQARLLDDCLEIFLESWKKGKNYILTTDLVESNVVLNELSPQIKSQSSRPINNVLVRWYTAAHLKILISQETDKKLRELISEAEHLLEYFPEVLPLVRTLNGFYYGLTAKKYLLKNTLLNH